MPDLAAYRLPLKGDGATGFALATDVVRRAVAQAVGIDLTGDHGSALGASAVAVRWRLLASPCDEDRVWTVFWEAPVAGDLESSWAMTTKVGLDGGRAWVIVRFGVVTAGVRMRPLPLGLEPPPLVLHLLDALAVEEDGQPLVSEPAFASEEDDAEPLGELLLDPARILPVVVISSAGTETLVDAPAVARTLAGVAHVVVLGSNRASRSLTSLLGARLSVFGGAVRLYWPGLTVASASREHLLWVPAALEEGGGPLLRRQLLDLLMPVAVMRFSSAPLEARIAAIIERERRAELRRLSVRAQEASLAVDWQDELERAWSENELLRSASESLSGQLAAAHENLRAVTSRLAAVDSATDPVMGTTYGSDQPLSVGEAVDWAASRCSRLVFLEESRVSARRATYRQPARVLKALVALDRAVVAWQRDELNGGFRRALAEEGFDYGHSLSAAAVGRFPHEYARTYLGRRIALGPHIRLGRGSPEACCRIYLYFDEDARVAVIGHVGNHLSDRTSG